jgi:seryl-tRNA synthetase
MAEEQLYELSKDGATEKPSDEDTELFKAQVSEWIKLDDQTRKLVSAIKERRTHQRVLAKKIQEFMIKYGYDNLKTTQGIIKSNVRTVKQPITVNTIRSKLEELLSGGENIQTQDYKSLVTSIFDAERPTVVKQSLTRRVPRISMSLDI